MNWWNRLPLWVRRMIWAEAQIRTMAGGLGAPGWQSISVPSDDSSLIWPGDEMTQARLTHVYTQMREHFVG